MDIQVVLLQPIPEACLEYHYSKAFLLLSPASGSGCRVAVAEGFQALENATDVEAAQAGGEEVVDGLLHLLRNLAVFGIWPNAPSSQASLLRCFGWEGPRCSRRDLPVRVEKDVFVISAADLFPVPEYLFDSV